MEAQLPPVFPVEPPARASPELREDRLPAQGGARGPAEAAAPQFRPGGAYPDHPGHQAGAPGAGGVSVSEAAPESSAALQAVAPMFARVPPTLPQFDRPRSPPQQPVPHSVLFAAASSGACVGGDDADVSPESPEARTPVEGMEGAGGAEGGGEGGLARAQGEDGGPGAEPVGVPPGVLSDSRPGALPDASAGAQVRASANAPAAPAGLPQPLPDQRVKSQAPSPPGPPPGAAPGPPQGPPQGPPASSLPGPPPEIPHDADLPARDACPARLLQARPDWALDHLDLHYCQGFGEARDVSAIPQDERLSALKFSPTGDFLIAGDWGGQCALFARCSHDAPPRRGKSGVLHPAIDYQLFAEFPCHARGYDYFRSMDVSSRVNAIEWLPSVASSSNYLRDPAPGELSWDQGPQQPGQPPTPNYPIGRFFGGYSITHHFLTASDTEVKLWSLMRADCGSYSRTAVEPAEEAPGGADFIPGSTEDEESARSVDSHGVVVGRRRDPGAGGQAGPEAAAQPEPGAPARIRLPQRLPGCLQGVPPVQVLPRRLFKNASGYHVNALSVSPMGDQFLISDDFTVSQWWIEDHTTGHLLIDLRPSGLDSLVLMITSAQWHPTTDGLFAFTLRNGITSICDFRRKCDCTGAGGLHFRSNLNDLLRLRFIDDRHLVVRDVMNMAIFDIRSTSNPIQMYPLNLGFTRELLAQLQSDPLNYFNPFDVAVDWRRRFVATGTYNDTCELFNLLPGDRATGMAFKVTGSLPKRKRQKNRLKFPCMYVNPAPLVYKSHAFTENYQDPQKINYLAKVSNLDFHPSEDILAVTTAANLYLYASIYDAEATNLVDFSEYCRAATAL